jgi:hypothetical protein
MKIFLPLRYRQQKSFFCFVLFLVVVVFQKDEVNKQKRTGGNGKKRVSWCQSTHNLQGEIH